MADTNNRAEFEITEPILQEHLDVRRRFVELWNERTSADAGAVDLAAAWQPVATLLEDHATAQHVVADPGLLREGRDEPEGTNDSHPAEDELDVTPDFPAQRRSAPVARR